ncbi:MAG TPA: WS/DGAT domain-containing protein, partial [Anaeromyxobacter sp.]
GTHTLMHLAELTLPAVAAGISHLEVAYCRFNFVVSNIPGPQAPRYLLGRRVRAFYPLIPLSNRQTLSIGMWSYCGAVGFGVLADADHVRDVALLARAIPAAVEELLAAARAQPVAEIGPARTPHDGVPLPVAPPQPAAVTAPH